jgi:hypothetical protein
MVVVDEEPESTALVVSHEFNESFGRLELQTTHQGRKT